MPPHKLSGFIHRLTFPHQFSLQFRPSLMLWQMKFGSSWLAVYSSMVFTFSGCSDREQRTCFSEYLYEAVQDCRACFVELLLLVNFCITQMCIGQVIFLYLLCLHWEIKNLKTLWSRSYSRSSMVALLPSYHEVFSFWKCCHHCTE